MIPTSKHCLSGRPTRIAVALMVCGLLGVLVTDTMSEQAASIASKQRPNGQNDLPPLRSNDVAGLIQWFDECGYPWSKQEVDVGKSRLLCIDLAPYSGQPGHHVFVYQLNGKHASLVFCAIVHNPPNPEKKIVFRFVQSAESLIGTMGEAVCLSTSLRSLLSQNP